MSLSFCQHYEGGGQINSYLVGDNTRKVSIPNNNQKNIEFKKCLGYKSTFKIDPKLSDWNKH